MSNKSYTSKYIISLLRSVLNGSTVQEYTRDIDWEYFLTVAKEHHIENILFYALKKIEIKPPKFVLDYINAEHVKSVMRTATQQGEIEHIIDNFNNNKIRFLALKGYFIKNYYPSSDMRYMSDFDVFIDMQNAAKVREILENIGYTFELCGKVHDNYVKRPVMHIEVHKYLMDDDMKTIAEYYDSFDAFGKGEHSTDTPYEYTLSKDDFYIYMIAHFAKHYLTYGIGIISVIDIYLFRKTNKLNYVYIESELKKLELTELNKKVVALSQIWFDDNVVDNSLEEMSNYIISSGSYGKAKNAVINNFINGSKQNDSLFIKKIKYFFFMVFPDKEYLSGKYPIVKEKPYLLPLYWVKRFFSSIFCNRQAIKLKLFTIFRTKNKDIDFHTEINKH
ncbi:MAG: nucleotidyltransferase family protein [Clostridia bacterium]|nr:nucleotidyltransferase family protein [Clostridia bacterium]